MTTFDDTFARERRRKTEELRALGIDPFPVAGFHPDQTVAGILEDPAAWIDSGRVVRLAGRITARRDMGRTVFIDLLDQGARIQLMLTRANLPETNWAAQRLLDLGDFVGVAGFITRTRAGETTVAVQDLVVLSKAAHPIPLGKASAEGAHDAMSDPGMLARMRHVGLNADPDLRGRVLKRARIIREVRRYFEEEGFVEVETPILGVAYGGAAARPFTTHANALDAELYLRISPECSLKRVLCGGIHRVFEIGRNFRNEGIDASHNPEFTMMEWYEAWSDYRHQQKLREPDPALG